MRLVTILSAVIIFAAGAQAGPQVFNECMSLTGETASLIIPAENAPTFGEDAIEPGDELAVFTPSGLCAGAAVWTGATIAIAIWGNNIATAGTDGFLAGEELTFRAARDGVIYGEEAESYSVVFHSDYDGGPYVPDAIFVIADLQFIDDGEEPVVPTEEPFAFDLKPAYPNPFAQQANIAFEVPETSDVRLEVFDMLGRRVAVVVEETLMAGRYERRFVAETNLASGQYVARLRAGDQTAHVRMTLIR